LVDTKQRRVRAKVVEVDNVRLDVPLRKLTRQRTTRERDDPIECAIPGEQPQAMTADETRGAEEED
jgi:hypothetical protein